MAGAGAHHLDVAGCSAPGIAKAVLVSDRAFADVGDDLHVLVRVRVESGAGSDQVVIPHAQPTPMDALGVAVVGKGEMMAGI
jgi:hypothetical protein